MGEKGFLNNIPPLNFYEVASLLHIIGDNSEDRAFSELSSDVTNRNFVYAVSQFSKIASHSKIPFEERRKLILEIALKLLKADFGGITQFSCDQFIFEEVVPSATPAFPKGTCVIAEKWYCINTIQISRSILCSDVKTSFLAKHAAYTHFPVEMYCSVPLFIFGRPYGTLFFGNYKKNDVRVEQEEVRVFLDIVKSWLEGEMEAADVEKGLLRRIAAEELIARTSKRLLHCPNETIYSEIQEALAETVSKLEVNHAWIVQFTENGNLMDETHYCSNRDCSTDGRQSIDVKCADYNWLVSAMRLSETIAIADFRNCGLSAKELRRGILEIPVKSFCAIPLNMNGIVGGFLALGTDLERKHWSGEHISFLQRIAEIFSVVIVRETEAKSRAKNYSNELASQRLDTLGVLAGGVAHDFNNLLMAILCNTELAMLYRKDPAVILEKLERVRLAARRAGELTGQLLAFAGKGSFLVKPVQLNNIIKETIEILESSFHEEIVIDGDFLEDLPLIEGDATQLQQVVMNLFSNAAEAIGKRKGVIHFSLSKTLISKEDGFVGCEDDPLSEGSYVVFEVKDTGCGMDEETQRRIFEPFFTTKFTGRGLGLAGVLGIVRGHKGSMYVESKLDMGTTFRVFLPVSKQSPTTGLAQGDCYPAAN